MQSPYPQNPGPIIGALKRAHSGSIHNESGELFLL